MIGHGCTPPPNDIVDLLLNADVGDPDSPLRLNPGLDLLETNSSILFRNAHKLLCIAQKENGLPTTERGNLSRVFVARMLEELEFRAGYVDFIRQRIKALKEEEVWDLHIARVVCEMAGMLRKQGRRFVVPRKYRTLLFEENAGRLFGALFIAFFRELDLNYLHGAREMPLLQDGVPVMLFILHNVAVDFLRPDELAERLVPPQVAEVIRECGPRFDDVVPWALTRMFLEPLVDFGLLEALTEPDDYPFNKLLAVRKSPIFDRFIHLRI